VPVENNVGEYTFTQDGTEEYEGEKEKHPLEAYQDSGHEQEA
jgi:hypothetical protein